MNLAQVCSEPVRRGLSKETIDLINYARRLLHEQNPMTLRQLHYAIFSRNEIDYKNDKASYVRLGRVTTTARRIYREWELDDRGNKPPYAKHGIDPSLMVDESRQPETPNLWTNAQGYVETIKFSYRRDNWQTQPQPQHVEIWSEKATVLGSIRPVARKWGLTTRVCHGYGSCGQEQEVGCFFASIKKNITVFYLGDHDPSGVQMQEDIHLRARTAAGRDFAMERVAIHAEDIAKFNLPPQRIKDTDSRAAGFRREFGDGAPTVELDALPVEELRRRIEEAVLARLDRESWDRQVMVESAELNCIFEFAERMKSMGLMNADD